jgi:hypothetical protein
MPDDDDSQRFSLILFVCYVSSHINMIQIQTMFPQAACACKCACIFAFECVLELVAVRQCVCVPGKMTDSVILIEDRFDPPGLWIPAYSPKSSVNSAHCYLVGFGYPVLPHVREPRRNCCSPLHRIGSIPVVQHMILIHT